MLCAPKADVTMEAKKTLLSSRSLPVKTTIKLQRHEEGFWKKKKNKTKKKILQTSNRALECYDKTNSNQLHSARYPLELTKQQWEIIVLYWLHPLAKEKVSFVFCLTMDLLKTPLGKLKVVCIRNISKTKSEPVKKIHSDVFQLKWRPHAKI